MVTAGRSQLRLALLSLPLLLHAAAAAHLTAPFSAEPFSVLEAIQTEVNTMNQNLDDLLAAIDNIPGSTTTAEPTSPPTGPTGPTTAAPPTETTKAPPTTVTTTAPPTTVTTTTPPTTVTTTTPPTTVTTTTPPTTVTTTTPPTTVTTTTPPTTTTNGTGTNPKLVENSKQQRLFISRSLLSLELDDIPCSELEDIQVTLNASQTALDLVTAEQFDNVTLGQLQDSNANLSSTITCIKNNEINVDNDTKPYVKSGIEATQASGKAASDVIDNIVNPPTPPAPTTQPPPEDDDSGFRAATIALGVLFSLSLIAVAGLAFYVHRLK